MASAVARSTELLVTSTPPNALSGSPASAFSQAVCTVFAAATPHTLLCLIIAKIEWEEKAVLPASNSLIN